MHWYLNMCCSYGHHVITIDCHLICSHFFNLITLLRQFSVWVVKSLDRLIRNTLLVPSQILGRVVVPQLFKGTQQLPSPVSLRYHSRLNPKGLLLKKGNGHPFAN